MRRSIQLAVQLKINQRVLLSPLGGEERPHYTTRIEDVAEEFWTVALPAWRGMPAPIQVGQAVEVVVTQKGAAQRGQAVVLERKLEPLPVLRLSYPTEWQRIQRRNFVRWPVRRPVTYRVLAVPDQEVDSTVTYEGRTADLSGGGLCLEADRLLPVGSHLELTVALDDGYSFFGEAEVARIAREDPEISRYWLGLRFLHLTEPEQDDLVRYVFALQRQARAKERSGN